MGRSEDLGNAARIFQNSLKIMHSHEPQRIEGSLLLIAATEGRREDAAAEKWADRRILETPRGSSRTALKSCIRTSLRESKGVSFLSLPRKVGARMPPLKNGPIGGSWKRRADLPEQP